MKKAFFCDANGKDHLCSDALCYLDGRWSAKTIGTKMSEYRHRYKKHFPHKYNEFSHYRIGSSVIPVPLYEREVD